MTATRPVALVTGASSSIGTAVALALAAAGFQVIGTSRNTSRVTPRDGVTFLDLDVTGDEPAGTAVQQVTGRSGRIDVLASNAGVGTAGAAEESSVAQAQSVFHINVFGLIRMTKADLPHMRPGTRTHHQHLLRTRVHPRSLHGRLRRVEARSRGLLRVLDHESANTASGCCSSSPPSPTPFDTNMVQADTPLPAYAQQRRIFGDVMAAAMKDGDDPAIVARMIVAAATGPKPRLRYTAGPAAGRVRTLRRVVPAWVSGKQIRKLNRLAGIRQPAPAADGAAAAVASSRLP